MYDTETCIGRLSTLFAQTQSQDGQAAQSWDVQDAGGSRKARTRGAVLQTPLNASCPLTRAGLTIARECCRIFRRGAGAGGARLDVERRFQRADVSTRR